MKELSIEEKAKRYDEIIEQLKKMMPNWENLSYNGKTFLQDLVHIIHELKESEDEKIRKELIEYHKTQAFLNGKPNNNHVKFVSWLEKQGEQFLANSAKTCKDEQFEKNRLAACDRQTVEEAEIERDFFMGIIEKEHRQPTFDDAIKYGMRLQKKQMLEKAVMTAFNVSLPCGVYDRLKAKGCKEGDKLLIIIKED